MLSILTVICPPLAVLLTAGPGHASKNVALTLLLYFPGLIHARSVVERYQVNRRYNTMMQLLEDRAMRETAKRAAQPRAA